MFKPHAALLVCVVAFSCFATFTVLSHLRSSPATPSLAPSDSGAGLPRALVAAMACPAPDLSVHESSRPELDPSQIGIALAFNDTDERDIEESIENLGISKEESQVSLTEGVSAESGGGAEGELPDPLRLALDPEMISTSVMHTVPNVDQALVSSIMSYMAQNARGVMQSHQAPVIDRLAKQTARTESPAGGLPGRAKSSDGLNSDSQGTTELAFVPTPGAAAIGLFAIAGLGRRRR